MIVSVQTHFHIQQHELLTPDTLNPAESLKYHYSAAAQRRILYRHLSCHVSAWHLKEPRVDIAGGSGAHMNTTGDVQCDVVIFSLYIYGNRMQTVCESVNE